MFRNLGKVLMVIVMAICTLGLAYLIFIAVSLTNSYNLKDDYLTDSRGNVYTLTPILGVTYKVERVITSEQMLELAKERESHEK